tara:strand:+ start:179 stop:430 length:252 start_codon:yes stop_codon:yes gene_type:complete
MSGYVILVLMAFFTPQGQVVPNAMQITHSNGTPLIFEKVVDCYQHVMDNHKLLEGFAIRNAKAPVGWIPVVAKITCTKEGSSA